jgi:hypothetical protein
MERRSFQITVTATTPQKMALAKASMAAVFITRQVNPALPSRSHNPAHSAAKKWNGEPQICTDETQIKQGVSPQRR